MKIRAREIGTFNCPPEIEPYLGQGQTFVTAGKEYEVQSISLFNGIVSLQIVDDIDYPAWYPFVLFEIVEGSLPSDWQCRLFPNNDITGVTMILGPEFIVKDEAAYEAMVELDPDQVDRFWKRVNAKSS